MATVIPAQPLFNELGYFYKAEADAPPPVVYEGASIQSQLDALDAKVGGSVQLAAGTYVLTEPLVLSTPNTALKGTGEKATVLLFEYDGIAIDVTALNCSVSDLVIRGPDRSNINAVGVKIADTASAYLHDLTFHGCKVAVYNQSPSLDTLIEKVKYSQKDVDKQCGTFLLQERKDALASSPSSVVSLCTVSDCKETPVWIKQSSSRTTVKLCSFDAIAEALDVIKFGSNEGVLKGISIQDNQFSGTSAASRSVVVGVVAPQTFDSVSIHNNSFAFVSAQHHVKLDTGSAAGEILVTGNTFSATSVCSVKLDNVVGCVVSDNVGVSTDAAGVLATTVNGLNVSGNTLFGTGVTPVVKLVSSTQSLVTGNKIINSGTGYGVELLTCPDSNVVNSNVITSTSSAAVRIDTSPRAVVSGCICTSTIRAIEVTSSNQSVLTCNRVTQTGVTAETVVLVTLSSGVSVVGNVVNGNGFDTLRIFQANEISVSGNYIENTVTGGCVHFSESLRSTCNGNVCITGAASAAVATGTGPMGSTTVASSGNIFKGSWLLLLGATVNQAPVTTDDLDVNI